MGAERPQVAGLVLAGGRGRRLGGVHKAFVKLCGRPLIAHVVGRLRPQVDMLAISANERREELQAYGQPVLPDPPQFAGAGPLAGVLAGLKWLKREYPHCLWLATAAVDTPFFPMNLVEKMLTAVASERATCAVVAMDGRWQSTFALWQVQLIDALQQSLAEGERRAEAFLRTQHVAVISYENQEGTFFFNINTKCDLMKAEELTKCENFSILK